MTYITTLLAGFFVGYLVFQRPQWATEIAEKIKAKLGL